jgi:hypothetical protein
MAMVGAMLGSVVGLAWCKPEDRGHAARTVGLLTNILLGGMVGLGVCFFAYRSSVRYSADRIVVDGDERRVEPPDDPNGYMRVWLFGYQVHQESGPREDMLSWQRRLQWHILCAFIGGGAFLGLLWGLIPRRPTNPVADSAGSASSNNGPA